MNTYIGIDLGTSAVKLLLVTADAHILNSVTVPYKSDYPQSGWSEQNPADWERAVMYGISVLLEKADRTSVKGIGIGGQMHGLVALDVNDEIIRPCILWNDGRTEEQTDYLNSVIGKSVLSENTANIAFAGFTAPKLLWLKQNEPHNFSRIRKIMLPKDYVVYKLCGEFSTDYSDASGTLLLDVKHKKWSDKMCEICDVDSSFLPRLYESYEAVGTLKKSVATELGLEHGVTVCAGAGDNAAAAVGTGTVFDGNCNISLGTSGTVFISHDAFSSDKNNALHSFCHANGGYHLMGCILSAASCNAWWMDNILKTKRYAAEQNGLEKSCGKNGVFFLPYLMGERSPHNDVNAKSAFIGMRPDTTRGEMTLAVLEGVTFALKDCVNIANACSTRIARTRICGGGAKSELWRQIIADVLNMPVETPTVEEGPSFGAAILAMVSCKEFDSVKSAVNELVKVKTTVMPISHNVDAYVHKYQTYTKLYPALKEAFASW